MNAAQKARVKRILDKTAAHFIRRGGPEAKDSFYYAAAEMYEDGPLIAAQMSENGATVSAAEVIDEVKHLMDERRRP